MPVPSTLARAAASPTTHALERNRGYVEYLLHEGLPMGPISDRRRCDPPLVSADGSQHLLRSPRGTTLTFTWRSRGRVWLALDLTRSNRLGYTAEYLSSHGWTYVGPAP